LEAEAEGRRGCSDMLALFELSFVSSLKTFRRRWTVNLYRRSCFKTNNDETRFSGTELGYRRPGGEAKVLKTFYAIPSSLASGAGCDTAGAAAGRRGYFAET